MNLVWKLLRRHVSVAQLAGFFVANLFGMLVVLLSVQFYSDVIPVFTQGDSFIKKDYLIVSKPVSMMGTLTGHGNVFSDTDIGDIRRQRFCKSVGAFTAAQYDVAARVTVRGMASFSTDMFFESVPDEYVDVNVNNWKFDEKENIIPIILPRSYLSVYNFGFAQSRSLPKLSEGVIGMLAFDVWLRGGGKERLMKGKVVGFSNRLNTILVPSDFMAWSNAQFAYGNNGRPARLIVEVYNPADENIALYFQDKGYEVESDKLDAGKTTFFLRVVSGIVLAVGLLISALSFYILMLSIYLLVQKNADKLQNLLLIGYSPARVSLPYQTLTILMNLAVLLIATGLLVFIRQYYMDTILLLFPGMEVTGIWPALAVGLVLFVIVSLINMWAVKSKVISIWKQNS